jgi:hypothetical protein
MIDKPKNPVNPSLIHHRQNPLESSLTGRVICSSHGSSRRRIFLQNTVVCGLGNSNTAPTCFLYSCISSAFCLCFFDLPFFSLPISAYFLCFLFIFLFFFLNISFARIFFPSIFPAVAQLVDALCYKPEGRGFDSRRGL